MATSTTSTPTTSTGSSGTSGSDTLNGTSGNDFLVYNISQNSAGTVDVYTGGAGIDTVMIEFTLQQWLLPSNQAQIAAYLAHLATYTKLVTGEVSNGFASDFTFTFGTSTLKVQMMENLMVTVDGVLQDPADMACVAADDAASVTEDSSALAINVLANDSVPDLVKSVALGTGPSHGTATLVQPNLLDPSTWRFDYQVSNADAQSLAAGQTRADSFTYVVTDADGDTSTATVSITITGTNDGPVAVADTGSVTENATLTLDLLANDTDVDDGHVFTLMSASALAGQGTASVAGNQLVFSAGSAFDHLAQGAIEVVTLSYTMQDEYGAASSSTATVTITGTNDGPVAVADTGAMTENATLTLDVLANDTDVDDGHAFTLVSAAAPTGKGTAGIMGNQLVFTPGSAFDYLAQGATEVVTLSYSMQDEHGATSSSTATITITGTNDAPVAAADTAAVTERASVTIDVLANDTDPDDGHTLTLVSGTAPAGKGTVSVVDNRLVFDTGSAFDYLAQGVTEDVNVTYSIKDEFGATASSTATITVTGKSATAVPLSIWEAGANNTGHETFAVDAHLALSGGLPGGVVLLGGNSSHGSWLLFFDGVFSYNLNNSDSAVEALNDGDTLTDTIAVTAGNGAEFVINVTINGANDAAVITGATNGIVTEAGAIGSPGVPQFLGILQAADVDNTPNLFVAASGNSSYGSFTMSASGAWTYMLNNANPTVNALDTGSSLADSFTVQSVDGTEQTLNITIEGTTDLVNHTPTSIELIPVEPGDNLPVAGAIVKLSTTDPDAGDSHTYSIVSSTSNSLTLVGNEIVITGPVSAGGSLQVKSTDAAGASVTRTFDVAFRDDTGTTSNSSYAHDTLEFGGSGADDVGNSPEVTSFNLWLFGQAGDDRLFGGAGNDWLAGGSGSDYLKGGAGADSFVFSAPMGSTNVDFISDFLSGTDKIVLENTGTGLFNALTEGALAASAFTSSGAITASTRIIYNTSNGELKYDADGSGGGAAVLIAVLGSPPAALVVASDFLII